MAPGVGIDCTIHAIAARIVYRSAAGGGLTVCYQCPVLVFVSPAVRISVAASARVSGNNSVNGQRTRSHDRSVGPERQHQRLRRGVNMYDRTDVRELGA